MNLTSEQYRVTQQKGTERVSVLNYHFYFVLILYFLCSHLLVNTMIIMKKAPTFVFAVVPHYSGNLFWSHVSEEFY